MTLEEFLNTPVVMVEQTLLPDKLGTVMAEVCDKHLVHPNHVLGKSRDQKVVQARREFIAILHFRYRYLPEEIARLMDMDRTSVNYHLGKLKSRRAVYAHLKSQYS